MNKLILHGKKIIIKFNQIIKQFGVSLVIISKLFLHTK